jgi:hypothetical protein
MREDIEALGFVMLQLMERGSRRRERLALEHPDKWSPQADKFLQLIPSSSARELLSVNYLNPQFVYLLIVLAYFFEGFTTKRGARETDCLCSNILAHTILS